MYRRLISREAGVRGRLRVCSLVLVLCAVVLAAAGCSGSSQLVVQWQGEVISSDGERADLGLNLEESEDGGVTGEMALVPEGEDPGDPVPVSGEMGEDDSFVLEGEQYGASVTIDGQLDSSDEMSGDFVLSSAFGGGGSEFSAQKTD